jgi:hypothetical protein
MPVNAPLDSSTLGQIQLAVQSLTGPELAGFLANFQGRFNVKWSDVVGNVPPLQRGVPTFANSLNTAGLAGASSVVGFTNFIQLGTPGRNTRAVLLSASVFNSGAAAAVFKLGYGSGVDPGAGAATAVDLTGGGLVPKAASKVTSEAGTVAGGGVVTQVIEQVSLGVNQGWQFLNQMQGSGGLAEAPPGTTLWIESAGLLVPMIASLVWAEVTST